MSASMTVSLEGNPFLDGCKDQARIVIDWISHTDGVVSLGIVSTKDAAEAALGGLRLDLNKIRGVLKSIQTSPGASGDLTTLLPTAYDLTLLDQYGLDVSGGQLLGRSAAVSEVVTYDPPIVVDASEITVTIASAGSGKKGRIIITLEALED